MKFSAAQSPPHIYVRKKWKRGIKVGIGKEKQALFLLPGPRFVDLSREENPHLYAAS
jgi:hypothetical protein